MVSGTFGSSSSPQEPEEPTPIHKTVPDTTDITLDDPIGPGHPEVVEGASKSLTGDVAGAILAPIAAEVAKTLGEKVEDLAASALHKIAEEIEQAADRLDHRKRGGVDITPFHQ